MFGFWESKIFWCVCPCSLSHFSVPGPICWSKDRRHLPPLRKNPIGKLPWASSPGSEVEWETLAQEHCHGARVDQSCSQ